MTFPLIETIQSAAQNSPEHMKLQQQLKLLGQQVQAAAAANKTTPQVSAQQLKQLAGKHQLVSFEALSLFIQYLLVRLKIINSNSQ